MNRQEVLEKWEQPTNVGHDGHVRLVDYMGGDDAIVQAARVSYGAGTKAVQEDRQLIRYLMRHRHTTPLEMVVLKFHVRVPMDTWRQWIRHRTASVNEYSTRYSEAIDSRVQTPVDKWRLQSTNNKQGSAGYVHEQSMASAYTARSLSDRERDLHLLGQEVYKERLEAGVAREQARKDLPLSTYTEAYWEINLHNLFHFLKLRLHPHAQLEIREYAQALFDIVKDVVPVAAEAFEDYQLHGCYFSAQEMHWLRDQLGPTVQHMNDNPNIRANSLAGSISTQRERVEFWSKINGN